MHYNHPSEIMDEIASLTPTFTGVNYNKLGQLGSIQWSCNEDYPEGTPTMHTVDFPIGKGRFAVTEYLASEERANRRFPLLLTTGRILSQYNVGAQTRRTSNSDWATNCPEYKVTAVQVEKVSRPSEWQRDFVDFDKRQQALLKPAMGKQEESHADTLK